MVLVSSSKAKSARSVRPAVKRLPAANDEVKQESIESPSKRTRTVPEHVEMPILTKIAELPEDEDDASDENSSDNESGTSSFLDTEDEWKPDENEKNPFVQSAKTRGSPAKKNEISMPSKRAMSTKTATSPGKPTLPSRKLSEAAQPEPLDNQVVLSSEEVKKIQARALLVIDSMQMLMSAVNAPNAKPAPTTPASTIAKAEIPSTRPAGKTTQPQKLSKGRGLAVKSSRGRGRVSTVANFSSPIMKATESMKAIPIGAKIGTKFSGSLKLDGIPSSTFTLRNGGSRQPILFVMSAVDDFDNFDLVKHAITLGGGYVVDCVDVLPSGRINLPVAPTLSFCVSTQPKPTPEFLFGIAYGCRGIYPTWVLECAQHGRLLDHSDYVLPAGHKLDGRLFLQQCRRMIFGGRKIIVVGTNSKLSKVLTAAGAFVTTMSSQTQIFGDEERSRLTAASYLLIEGDLAPTSPFIGEGKAAGKPLVTPTWLAQSLIFGRIIDPNCNEKFLWSPSQMPELPVKAE